MKKQLLIAAVAATMTSAAMADISITGGAKVNYLNTENGSGNAALSTNAINHDVDFTIKGQNGDTAVTMTVATTAASTSSADTTAGLNVEDTYLTTKVGDIAIKTGTWMTGDDMLNTTSRAEGKFEASTSFSGVKVTYTDTQDSNATVKLATTLSDVAVSYERGTVSDTYTLDTTVAGFGISYKLRALDAATSDKDSLMLTKEFNGVTATYAQANADTSAVLAGDSWLGDYEGAGDATLVGGDDVSGFGAAMSVAGNTIQVKSITVDATSGNDTDFTKFYVTRPLAGGATFEAIYTDKDVAGSTENDSKILDLELAVKF
ncbi:hypothetical protein [Candidatus Thioglobus autotrophicus]|uniref:hypothetical protein n=1 Tax=Candidatus Thioglobus autotrophicus TaxID=1705394 RepID=UPI00299EDE55|nr:hypothetical protein [Candidatus Thioglobus autotrophicus]WPE17545.1 hypothetical protein R5P05_05605 [Candidatus Thioglobus autotrophicus]